MSILHERQAQLAIPEHCGNNIFHNSEAHFRGNFQGRALALQEGNASREQAQCQLRRRIDIEEEAF
jgi:hypothetical protein